MTFSTRYDSPLGVLQLTSDGVYLTGLWMGEHFSDAVEKDDLSVFLQTKAWLDAYFRGNAGSIGLLPLRAEGTLFQRRVWHILAKIPCGETRTYGGIAKEMAALMGKEKMSPQAVGQAVGSNPISIIIPCHRVVGAGGKLTGYAGGLDKKIWLLRHEGIPVEEERK